MNSNRINQENLDENGNSAREVEPKPLIDLEKKRATFKTTSTICYIEVKLNGWSINALVDTGAASSFISPALVQKCGLTHLVDNRYTPTYVGFGGLPATTIGKMAGCGFMIGKTSLMWSFGVRGRQAIIGADFLKHFEAQLDFPKHTLTFKIAEGKISKEAPIKIFQNHSVVEMNENVEEEIDISDEHEDELVKELTEKMKNANHCEFLTKRHDWARKTIPASLRGSNVIVLKVQLNGHSVEAVIDTGDTVGNLITEKLVASFGLENKIDSRKRREFYGAGGLVKTFGMISNCVLKFGKHASYVNLEIIDDKDQCITLGMGFLKGLNATINYTTQQLEFSKNDTHYHHPFCQWTTSSSRTWEDYLKKPKINISKKKKRCKK